MERDDGEPSSRDKVLRAAMQMFGDDPGTRLTVRAVAARAGVSTGSLRYHFPTQRELQDEVLTRIYDLVVSDDTIHDTTTPARDRLVDCLRQVLVGTGVGEQARAATLKVVREWVEPEPTEDNRAAYLAMEREMQRRVEYWLTVLANEGAVAADDTARRAKFLLTVVNGLGLERALPAEESLLQTETDTLYTAVDGVLGPRDP
ncbi:MULTISPECIES: TetR/AcrR family transcriptional regulator [unclassified Pseudonocardia]|uniref:TetR/AcrR family transcriptional regulator n=1 Tax=unclassified Pseudonocardia TaxID=2619320 RepID=UPI0001FFE759|nr:TetR/AcrR family transcriptional regulator [Pseudonocardia sp. Ae707_Ps1]OLM19654.1 Transcriptional regulator [Pseudonocardia sp. Ae707_Ps1]